MSLKDRLLPQHTELEEKQAEQLQHSPNPGYTLEIQPPKDHDKNTLPQFIRTIQELQTQWLGLKNTSPTTSYELRRTTQGLKIQYTVPTKRLERKIRTQLTNHHPKIKFKTGTTGLPVQPGDTIGGGLITTGRRDHYPLKTEFDQPPTNTVTTALHRHSMQGTRIILQTLFKPAVGKPVKNWYWNNKAYRKTRYLRKEKENLWGRRQPTKREKRQADAIENKAGNNRFHTSIRFIVINAGEHTKSRIKELSGAYNTFENPETGQYFDTTTVQPLRGNRIIDFADSVSNQRLDTWNRSFQATPEELAALTAIPSTQQENIQYASP
jgi:hypothetical protein